MTSLDTGGQRGQGQGPRTLLTHPPALALVPLHLLPEDVNLLVRLVQLHLGLLLRDLIFPRGALTQKFILNPQMYYLHRRLCRHYYLGRVPK